MIIGVDGGGSKTQVILADDRGELLGEATIGPSNLSTLEIEKAIYLIDDGIKNSFINAGLQINKVSRICLGLAGVDRPGLREQIEELLLIKNVADEVIVLSDAEIVLAAGIRENWGVALISGTGSFAWGKNAQGTTCRAGGWGPILGDEGSAYSIGREALKRILRSIDNRESPTELTQVIFDHLGLASANEIVILGKQLISQISTIANLASLVNMSAENGDQTAIDILEQAGFELALSVDAVARGLGISQIPFPLAIAGGVILNSQIVKESLNKSLLSKKIHPFPIEQVAIPALGAVKYALSY